MFDDPDFLDPRPCNGRNSNICVAQGCYGEACLDLPARAVLFPLVWEGDYA